MSPATFVRLYDEHIDQMPQASNIGHEPCDLAWRDATIGLLDGPQASNLGHEPCDRVLRALR